MTAAAIVSAALALVATLATAWFTFRAQGRSDNVVAKGVVMESYDELVQNQAHRIKSLESREGELERQIEALRAELEQTRAKCAKCQSDMERLMRTFGTEGA